jgi:hypothetical protein
MLTDDSALQNYSATEKDAEDTDDHGFLKPISKLRILPSAVVQTSRLILQPAFD